ncbi:hypothetical protein [Motilimonas eburnea]|uniref:hypothetical protein n=1 Tax=Motilimonas eburnea TaxID=1737488 RepID=UPI001E329E56|nr:hypothetical protein [Motilimonas eburnea]MCE2570369.1 hypothetical protein [Motilimonas eburnea]
MVNKQLNSICESHEQVQQQLAELGSYDSPCFILITSNAAQQSVRKALNVGASRAQIAISEPITLTKDTWLLVVNEAHTEVKILANEMLTLVKESGSLIWIGVFRHNSIGNPQQTLRWNVQQLQSLIQDNQNTSGLAINDFTDKRNWPGIEPYLSNKQVAASDQDEANLPLESTRKPSWLRRMLNVFSTNEKGNKSAHQEGYLNYAESVLAFPLNEELIRLAPFIVHLPAGELLWQYVLTGEHGNTIREQDILLDLDHVLVSLHAKRFAPDFFEDICDKICRSGFPEQADIFDDLDRILMPLANELLAVDEFVQQKRDCYLRILDIFYHLFDQTPFNDDLFEQLVEDEDTAFLTETEYQQRYAITESVTDELSCSQAQTLRKILDGLEYVSWLDHSIIKKIARLRRETRKTCDPTGWALQGERNEWLLAAILLAFDSREQVFDQYSAALKQLVDDHLHRAILEDFSDALKPSSTLPDGVTLWFTQFDVSATTAQAMALELGECLELVHDAGAESKAQPRYELFKSSSDFYLVLAICYWRYLAEPNELCLRVISLALALEPQATLNHLVQFYAGRRAGFESEALAQEFYLSLKNFNVIEEDLFAFNARFAQQHDSQAYAEIITQYVKFNANDKERFNRGLLRLRPHYYQRFFTDVSRLNPSFDFPTAHEYVDIFREIHRHAQRNDEEVLASYFNKADVLFVDYLEFLPEALCLPIKASQDTRFMPWPCNFAVLRLNQDHLELVVDSMNRPFDKETGHLYVLRVLILGPDVTNEAVFSIIDSLPDALQRSETIERFAVRYIEGDIAFDAFNTATKHFIDRKVYSLDIEGYSQYVGHILSVILTEKDREKRLRLISILASHPTHGQYVLADICAELYLDTLLAGGAISFDERREIEIEDLTAQGQKELEAFKAETAKQLARLYGEGEQVC